MSLGNSLKLAFADHMHDYIALNGPLPTVWKAPNPKPGRLILFHDILQIFALAEHTALGEYSLLLKDLKGGADMPVFWSTVIIWGARV